MSIHSSHINSYGMFPIDIGTRLGTKAEEPEMNTFDDTEFV